MFITEHSTVLNEAGRIILSERELLDLLERHSRERERLERLYRYYAGKHDILARVSRSQNLPNNRIMVNHAKYITDIATGYMVGNPISYTGDDLEPLLHAYKAANIYSHDTALGKSASIFGKSFELIYTAASGLPGFAAIDPRQAFLLVEDNVEHTPLLGVRYYTLKGKSKIFLYSDQEIVLLMKEGGGFREISREPNLFGAIPLVEYDNNEEQTADYEDVLTLIDAYNILCSDRVNDKEQFVNCLLVLTNCNIDGAAYEKVQKWGVMALSGEGRAEYLTKTLNEADTEILRTALEADIHKISMVPALTDKNFGGNVSGLAMEYKLLGFEQKIKIKERFFIRGLRRRLDLTGRFLELQGQTVPQNVEIIFTRAMPMDTMEVAQMISLLNGMVSKETLLAQLPFINNVAAELTRLENRNEKTPREERL